MLHLIKFAKCTGTDVAAWDMGKVEITGEDLVEAHRAWFHGMSNLYQQQVEESQGARREADKIVSDLQS